MTKIMVLITTRAENRDYFYRCLESLANARRKVKKDISIVVMDFGVRSGVEKVIDLVQNNGLIDVLIGLIRSPGKILVDNVNDGISLASGVGADFLAYFNDDIAIHSDWFKNAIEFMEENPRAGFVGSTYPAQGWNMSLVDLEIPDPEDKAEEIINLTRLYWEFSCCMIRIKAAEEIGPMDRRIGPPVGYMADNDYILRMQLGNWETWRSYMLTAWHSKGLTQSHFRRPGKNEDPIREQALGILREKWKTDFSNFNKIITIDDVKKKLKN